MNEIFTKGLKSCLITLAAVILIGLAFVAGYVSGNQALPSPVAEQIELEDTDPAKPTTPPLPSPVVVTRVVTPTPGDETPEPAAPEPVPTRSLPPVGSFDLYWEVWDLIERDFYGELPSQEDQLYGAIRGTLQTLDDDYTSFTEPAIAEINRRDMSGSFEGIGAIVTMNDANQLEIVRPLEGQPAEEAGLKAEDIVIAVDGTSIEGMGLYEAIALIRGPKGTPVVLTILRMGEPEPLEVEIIRARIPMPTIEFEMLENDIAYIRLYEFNGQASTRLQEALEELLVEEPAGLILDLRNNPGGYLSQAVSVADEFLPSGVVLYERGNDLEEIFDSTDKGLAEDIPMVVLINGGSASASEIVAGAIQDLGRAPLIGEISFGKGSVQQVHTLSDGSELRITVARWFTPDNRAIHGTGLEPDFAVPFTEEDQENDRDPQLESAIEYLITGE